MELRIIQTGDGSHTLFVPELKEHYHSTFGAIGESRHIFIEAGLRAVNENTDPVSIFEAGFGTGLNALLTLLEINKSQRNCQYTSIEKFPLDDNILNSLNYSEQLGLKDDQLFRQIHEAAWNMEVSVSSNFMLHKIKGNIEDIECGAEQFDLIFFDAFGPDVQPELWTEGIFAKLFRSLKPGGILVTYSAKGSVKRALQSAGFSIEKLPGPPGKREFIRALK